MKHRDFTKLCRVEPGRPVRLRDFDPGWNGDSSVPKSERKQSAQELLAEGIEALAAAQELLYADNSE